MKTFLKTLTLLAVLLSLVVGTSCYRDPLLRVHYDGNWKLEGIDFGDEQGFVELEPKDCDTCYILTIYDKNGNVAHGISISNTVEIIETWNNGFERKVTITEGDEPFDGNLYCEALKSMTGKLTESNKNKLKINFYWEGKSNSVLIYKRITP